MYSLLVGFLQGGARLQEVFLCSGRLLSSVLNLFLCSLLSAVPLAAFVTSTHSSCLQRQSDKLNRESCSLSASLSVWVYMFVYVCMCTYVSINIVIAFNVNILVLFLSTMSQYPTKRQHREEGFPFGWVWRSILSWQQKHEAAGHIASVERYWFSACFPLFNWVQALAC